MRLNGEKVSRDDADFFLKKNGQPINMFSYYKEGRKEDECL